MHSCGMGDETLLSGQGRFALETCYNARGKPLITQWKLEVSQNQTLPGIIVSTLVLAKMGVDTQRPGQKPAAGCFVFFVVVSLACLAAPRDKDRVRMCIWRLKKRKINQKNQ